jgi:hypothetical protein
VCRFNPCPWCDVSDVYGVAKVLALAGVIYGCMVWMCGRVCKLPQTVRLATCIGGALVDRLGYLTLI